MERTGAAPAEETESGALSCAHCAEPLAGAHALSRPIWRPIGGVSKPFCCLGCVFIAEQIALTRADSTVLSAASAVSDPAAERASVPRQPARCQIEIRGMACAACALLIEARLRATPGVAVGNVDFVARRATLVYDRNRVALHELQRTVERAGYRVAERARPEQERREQRIELLRVAVAWLAMMQVMMLAVPDYLARPGEIGAAIGTLLHAGQAILTAPVLLFSAAPLWRAAFSQLRTHQLGMDVPVALGLAAALGASVFSLQAGRGEVYFDSITMFVALLLSVRWWQQRALARASAQIDAAAARDRGRVLRLRDYPRSSEFDAVGADSLVPGDRAIVPAGALVPADGRVLEGRSALSQAWLTGEAIPVDVAPGTRVVAGSMNLNQPLVIEVLLCGEGTSLAALQRLIVQAASQRPRSVELANQVAAHFVWVLLAVSLLTALGWVIFDASSALRNAIAVLIVTCPCALSLAAPLASAAAQAALARRSVLLARPAALEELARADIVAFDKTGTLTEAEPVLTAIEPMRDRDAPGCLAVAASLESRSVHPFARAVQAAARKAGVCLAGLRDVTEEPGAGVQGVIGNRLYRFGKPHYALALAGLPARSDPASTPDCEISDERIGACLVLADQRGALANLRFGEHIRTGASDLIDQLARSGAQVALISGDRRDAVEAVAQQLNARSQLQLHCEHTPVGKQVLLARWQAAGRRVVMIGDGINDAPVLAQADASIALASGSDLAQARADVLCLRSDLGDVGFVFEMARRATRAVRVNLSWAIAYNAAMVPLAVAGHLSPLIAAVGMAASSAVVLANSLRLNSPDRSRG
ncbi:MAG: heavy metal translocating P-type ATPase [Burkholderiaceae bacterium]|nr:heavy metal translocating P-type ATPase [Burkholderiaceae bacterium]